jgi:methylenetetrahydrofolate dehydrogenase (NADP+)/methenyltetrahydrofolate cyclohydrolase
VKATIYDGKTLVTRLSSRIKRETERLRRQRHIEVGLGILMVTGDQVSMSDTTRISSTAEELGIRVQVERVAQRNIARKFYPTLEEYASSPFIQGIYIQLPLPTEIIPLREVMDRLPPEKDVGGIHFINRGISTYPSNEVEQTVIPPEIQAIVTSLHECKVEMKGGKIVLVGSHSSGSMVRLLGGHLYRLGCDVRMLWYENFRGVVPDDTKHRFKSVENEKYEFDSLVNPEGEVVITWVNQPGWLTGSRLKPDSVVIDMGYKFARSKISGDVDFQTASQVAKILTPVPGGVRNIVRIMILTNLMQLIKKQLGESDLKPPGALRRRFGQGG